MKGKNSAAAVKLRQKRAACWGNLLFDAAVLGLLPKELLMETLARLRRMGLARGLRFMWQTNREPLYGLAIFTVLALSLLVSLLCILSLSARLARLPDNMSVNAPARHKETQTAKGSAAMSRQPMSNTSLVVMVGVIAAIMISAAASDPDAIIPAVTTIIMVAAIVTAVIASKKAKADKSGRKETAVPLHRPFPQPTAVKTRPPARVLRHADEAEEVISCAHKSGKEKYLEQVEGFYKNGLIDRAEYKILREKYENMDIPEDYH